MNETTSVMMKAAGWGAVAGMRSMLPLAFLSQRHESSWLRGAMATAAAGELCADKWSGMPSRTDPVPLLGRAVLGGAAAAVSAPGNRRIAAAVVGLLAALGSTYAVFHLRRLATQKLRVHNVLAGMAEDAAALGLSRALTSRSRTRRG